MGIAEDLQEKWEGILQWSDDNNLPLRGISDSLEEKGIPAMPFFIFLILLLVGGILYFTVFKGAGGGITIFEPAKVDILLVLSDATGQPVPDAQLTIASTNGAQVNLQATTNFDGEAGFKGLKVGTTFEVSASDSGGNALTLDENSFAVLASTKVVELRLSSPVVTQTVTVSVEVKGPTDGETVHVAIIGTDGFPIGGTQTGLNTRFPGLAPNSDYTVRANAEGFVANTLPISVKDRDLPVSITLKTKEKADLGIVKVLVVDAVDLKPLKDAVVDITEAETGGVVFSKLKTGENGYIPQKEVKLGKKIKVVATLKGYIPGEIERGVEDDTKIQIELSKVPESDLKAIKIAVKDEKGSQIPNPIVKLFNSKNTKIAESNPADGIAVFNDVGAEEYFATIFKVGYVPASIQPVTKGNSYEVKLAEATSTNSAKLKVLVENQNEDAVPQASVALFYEDGVPVGTVDKITATDGYATYDELPLVKIYAKATYNGRVGTSGIIELKAEGTGEEEGYNLLRVVLKPAKGRVVISVKDHFSGKNVEGAKVEFSKAEVEEKPGISCTTKNGKCTAQMQEGFYIATISASGYDLFTSSELEVKPNIDNKYGYELIASQIAQTTKLVFNGVYTLEGDNVNSLAPSTTYNAKFTITRPRVKINKAEVQVRIGNPGSLDSEVAEITGYDAAGAFVTKGATSDRPDSPLLPVDQPSPSPSVNASLNFADPAEDAYKYVNFEFPPFEGSKEVSVQFRTKAVASGKVDLQYRSAFFTQSEELRDPADETAPRNAFLANMNSKIYQIEFEGKCENNICLQVHFEGNSGTAENNFEAQIAETFKLIFKLVSPKGTSVELSAPLNDQTIALSGGSSGDAKAVLKTTEDTQISALSTPDDNAGGEFSIVGRRLANNVDFRLDVKSAENTVSRTLSARIVGERPDLKVSYTIITEKSGGKVMNALKDNKLIFTVTDSLDNPLKNAYVTLGSGTDALGGLILDGSPQEAKDGTFTYVFENINPPSVGLASYKIVAEGFKQKKGTIPVQATTLISLDTKALSMLIRTKDEQTTPFTVQNLLSNEVRVSYSLIFQGQNAQYTDVVLDAPLAKLKASETNTNILKAKISDAILLISKKPETLKEKIQGRVHVSAKLGNTLQDEDIPFVVDSEFEQLDFDSLWEISEKEAKFGLAPPDEPEGEQVITVTNNGPYPMLVNHQSKTQGVTMSPNSIVIEPAESAEITIKARARNVDSCRFEDESISGKLEFFASSEGLVSKKTLDSGIAVSSSENCYLKDGKGIRIRLPIGVTAELPTGTKTKYNKDGSIFIELASGEMFIFDAGAQVTKDPYEYQSTTNLPSFSTPSGSSGNYIKVPPGVFMEIPSTYVQESTRAESAVYSGYNINSLSSAVQPLATSSWRVLFPFATILDFEPETEFSKYKEQRVASIEDIDIFFPLDAPLTKGKSDQERRASLDANMPITIELTPLISSEKSLAVSFPVEVTFMIQDSIRLRSDDFTGSRAIQFPNDVVISLPPDASFSKDPVAQGGSGSVTSELRKIIIPAGSEIRVPSPYAKEGLQGQMLLTLPFRVQFKIPKDNRVSVALDEVGVGAKSISTEIYEIIFAPGRTKASLEFSDGTRLIETQASTPMTIQPTDFGAVGPRRRLPVAITINLPSSGTVKTKGGLTQLEFENGNRMMFESGEIIEKAFEAKEINIPANTEITFSANSPNLLGRLIIIEQSAYATERFTIFIPAQVAYHFPTSNAVLKPPNVIRNELESYEITFNVDRISFQKGDGSTNDVMLGPLQSFAGVRFSEADKTLPGRDFEFAFSFPMTVELPENAFQTPRLEPYNQKRGEIFHSFRMNDVTDIKFGDPNLNDEFTVRASRLMVANYVMGSADFLSDPKTFMVPPGTLMIPKIQKEENGKFMLHGTFGRDLAFTLPTGIAPSGERSTFVDLKGCTEIRFQVGERTYFLPAIRSIQFPDDSRAMPYDSADAEALQQIIMRAGGKVDFELCEGRARRTGAAIEPVIRALIAFESPAEKAKPDVNDQLIDVEFTDSSADATVERFICAQNWGFKPLDVEFRLEDDVLRNEPTLTKKKEGYDGDSISTELEGAIKSVTRPKAWESGPKLRIGSVDPEKQKCDSQSFKLEIGIPKKYLDEDNCILPDFKEFTSDPEKTFVTIFGVYDGMQVAQKIGIRIKLKKEGACAGSTTKQFREMLGGFFVNYANDIVDLKNIRTNEKMKLYFKGPTADHVRPIVILNNLDEAVSVSYKGVNSHLSFVGSPPAELEPGKGRIVEISAQSAGEGSFEITGTGKKTGKAITHFVRYEVFPLDASMEKIYYSSPMGDLAPQAPEVDVAAGGGEGTGSAAGGNGNSGSTPAGGTTVSARKEIVFVGESRISFVEASPKASEGGNGATGGMDKAESTGTAASSNSKDELLGSVTEVERKLPEAVMVCQTNFCSSAQVAASFEGFAKEFQLLMQNLGNTDDDKFTKEIGRFCDKLGTGGVYSKSIVIQAANAKSILSEEAVQGIIEKVFEADMQKSGMEFKVSSGEAEIGKCGIYVLSGKLNVCTPRPAKKEDWLRNNAFIEFKIEESKECGETIANAPLLFGERGSTQGIIGREATDGLEFSKRENTGTGFFSILGKIQFLNIGPYKEASDKKDLSNLNELYTSFYLTGRKEGATIAEPYDDNVQCVAYAKKAMVGVAAGVGAGLLLGLFSNLGQAATGVGAVTGTIGGAKVFQAGYATVTALSICGVMAGQAYYQKKDSYMCQASNDCLYGAIAAGTEGVIAAVPGGTVAGGLVGSSKALFGKFLKDTVANTLAVGVSDAAILGVNAATGDDKSVYTPAPVAYGLVKLKRTFGTKAYMIDYLVRNGHTPKSASKAAAQLYLLAKSESAWAPVTKTLGLKTLGGTTTADLAAHISARPGTEIDSALRELDISKFDLIEAEKLRLADAVGDLTSTKTRVQDLIDPLERRQSAITYSLSRPGISRGAADAFRDELRSIDSQLIPLRTEMRATDSALDVATRVSGRYDADLLKKTAVRDSLLSKGTPEQLKEIAIKADAGGYPTKADIMRTNGLTQNEVDLLQTEAEKKANNWRTNMKKKLGGEYNFDKAKGLVAILVPMLFHIDVRPVQGALDYRFPNHFVVFNVGKVRGSMMRICSRDFEEEDTCRNTIYTKTLCDSGSYLACIYLVKGRQFATQEGYALLAGINAGMDSKKLINSLFVGSAAPLKASEANPSKLKIEYMDKLDSLPLDSPAEEEITADDPATAARRMYEILRDNCDKYGACPPNVTSDFLKKMKDKVETDPQGAMDDMAKASGAKK